MKGLLVRVLAFAALLLALLLLFPTSFARAFTPLLHPVSASFARDYVLDDVTIDGRLILMQGHSTRMQGFTMKDGRPGPEYSFHGAQRVQAVNMYPLIVFAILLAWPATWRRRWCAVLLALIPVLLVGALDTYVMFLRLGAVGFSKVWNTIADQVAMSPAALETGAVIQREFSRVEFAKSFLNTGGRQFIALVIVALSLAPRYLSSGMARSNTCG